MASYVITGANRGLGWEFVTQLSADPNNTVFGLARNKDDAQKRVDEELSGRSNVHMLSGDLSNYKTLKESAEYVSKVTGGKLDYIIANAAVNTRVSAYAGISDFADQPELLEKDLLEHFQTNLIGNVHLINIYLPLILKGSAKKIVAISTGMADIEMIRNFNVHIAAPYAISKAGLNTAMAKFSAQYSSQGVLFLSISPGLVATSQFDNPTEEQKEGARKMVANFAEYAPGFKGPITPEESVNKVMGVINNASVEKGDGGAFISHLGSKQWL